MYGVSGCEKVSLPKKKMSKTTKKTLFLAVFATSCFVYSAIVHFDVPFKTMLNFFVSSTILVFIAIVLAVLGAAVISLLRKR